MNSAKVAVLLLLALMATVALADRGHGHDHDHGRGDDDCRECNKCSHHDNWCRNNCKKECKKEGGINIEKCKSYGNDAGFNAAKAACDLTSTYCRGSSRSFGAPPQRTKVSLQQCGNAAYGVCQAKAMDPKQSPCASAFKGMANCNEAEFQKFYTGEVDWNCNQATAAFDKS